MIAICIASLSQDTDYNGNIYLYILRAFRYKIIDNIISGFDGNERYNLHTSKRYCNY